MLTVFTIIVKLGGFAREIYWSKEPRIQGNIIVILSIFLSPSSLLLGLFLPSSWLRLGFVYARIMCFADLGCHFSGLRLEAVDGLIL